MEKKVTKKFYLLSLVNVLAIIVMTGGALTDTLALFAVLVVLVLNHTTLLKMVSELSKSMTSEGESSKQSLKKILFLMFIKMTLLGGVVLMTYFYNKELTPKVLLLMIFQLIIQVVSIKNNY
jgi:hypothetical protein